MKTSLFEVTLNQKSYLRSSKVFLTLIECNINICQIKSDISRVYHLTNLSFPNFGIRIIYRIDKKNTTNYILNLSKRVLHEVLRTCNI